MAKEFGLYIVAGSVPLASEGKIYNASFVYNNKGECIAKHRKTHLFDINVEGGQYFMESDTFTAGKDVTTFPTPWGKMGLIICYDIRFDIIPRRARYLCTCGFQHDHGSCPLGTVLPYARAG